MLNKVTNSLGNHIDRLDYIRVLACFMVVLAHCCDPFVGKFDNSNDWVTAVGVGSSLRPCVPLFAMISGVLLFPVKLGMLDFYKRRAKRIGVPFIVWSLALPLMYYAYFTAGVQTSNANIMADNYTWAATLDKLWTWLFNFNYDTTPLWYMYMLIGLYLFIPVISAWLERAKREEVKLFLGIWMVSMMVPFVQMFAPMLGYAGNYGNLGIWGVCDWNPYGLFYNFSGFMGYMVLAHYLTKYPLDWSWKKTFSIITPMYLVGFGITFWGYLETQKLYPGDYSKLEILWYFSGIQVFMMTFAIWVLMSKLPLKENKLMKKLASLTLGIFLAHFFFVQVAYDTLQATTLSALPAFVQIALMAVLAFTITLILVWGLSISKLTRKSVM